MAGHSDTQTVGFGPRGFSPMPVPPLATKGFPLSPHGDNDSVVPQVADQTTAHRVLPLAARYVKRVRHGGAASLNPVLSTGTLNN